MVILNWIFIVLVALSAFITMVQILTKKTTQDRVISLGNTIYNGAILFLLIELSKFLR